MKKYLMAAAAVLVALVAVSCSGPSPSSVAQEYLNAVGNLDFKKAQQFATEESKSTLQMIEGMMAMVPKEQLEKEKGKKVTIVKEKIDGETATVEYTAEGVKEAQVQKLKKVKGEWKVDAKKDEGAAPAEPAAPPSPAEAPPAETAK